MNRGFTRLPRKVFAIPRLCVLLITTARPCLSDIPFDARNWKSFGGRFHSTSARKFAYSRPLHLLKSDPSPPLPTSLFANDGSHANEVTTAVIKDEFDRIHSPGIVLEKNPGFVWSEEAGSAATNISGPCDKELNFSLVYFILEFVARTST